MKKFAEMVLENETLRRLGLVFIGFMVCMPAAFYHPAQPIFSGLRGVILGLGFLQVWDVLLSRPNRLSPQKGAWSIPAGAAGLLFLTAMLLPGLGIVAKFEFAVFFAVFGVAQVGINTAKRIFKKMRKA